MCNYSVDRYRICNGNVVDVDILVFIIIIIIIIIIIAANDYSQSFWLTIHILSTIPFLCKDRTFVRVVQQQARTS